MKKPSRDKMVRTAPVKKTVPKKEEACEEKQEDDSEQTRAIEKAITQEVSPEAAWKNLSRGQIELMKRTIAKNATDDELKLFISVCVGAQLNPYLRQVHFVKRWDSKEGKEVGTIQVGIDGFRAIAESGGQYAGSDDAVFKDEKEIEISEEKDKIKRKMVVPGSATVTVHKLMEGSRYPFTATARWAEYYPGNKQGYMWKKMPYGQLGKCAEALALRKAFPKLLSGLYTPEEMDQAQTGNAQKGPDMFAKAIGMISKANDARGLIDFSDKLAGSEKYTDDQKIKLSEAIAKRVKELGYVEGEVTS